MFIMPLFSLLVIINLLFSSFKASGQSTSLYTMKWQDQFDGSSVDSTSWTYRTDAKANSAQLAANVAETGGEMVVNLKKQSAQGYNYTGGGLVSKANFQYGYFESRIKMNSGQGWHSSFWLMTGDGSSTYNVASHTHSEIDIFERESTENSRIASNINLWNADARRNTSYGSGILTTTHNFTTWNVFGAYWTENFVLVFIDGAQAANLSLTPQRFTHNYLNIWLTSIGYGPPPDDSALPSKFEVDYVQYWQKDYYVTSGTLCFAKAQGSTPCASNATYAESGSSWATSAIDGYTLGLTTRYSCHVAGAVATWQLPSTPSAGTYQVWVWVMVYPNSDSQASYAVKKNGSVVTTTVIDQTSGSSGWVLLNSAFAVASSDTCTVSVTGSGNTCVRADSVKFVRTA